MHASGSLSVTCEPELIENFFVYCTKTYGDIDAVRQTFHKKGEGTIIKFLYKAPENTYKFIEIAFSYLCDKFAGAAFTGWGLNLSFEGITIPPNDIVDYLRAPRGKQQTWKTR
jgi:hypothetical protein